MEDDDAGTRGEAHADEGDEDDDPTSPKSAIGKGAKGKKRRRRSDTEEFGNLIFDYGGVKDLTPQQHKDFHTDVDVGYLEGLELEKIEVRRQRRRRLFERNRLLFDERPLKECDLPIEYWKEVLRNASIQSWCDEKKVLRHLATCRPMAKPANTKPWRLCRIWILKALASGSKQSWSDHADIQCYVVDDSIWEAVRIIGDADEGFGTFPRSLYGMLLTVGAGWVVVEPEKRIIPMCWKKWADRHDVKYAKCQPGTYIPRPRDVVGLATTRITLPESQPLRLTYSTFDGSPLGAMPPYDDASINLVVVQDKAESIGDVNRPVVTPNIAAANALQRLKEMEFAVDQDGDIDEDDVLADALQSAIIDGPIEERINELINESFRNAGIETTQKLRDTVQRIALDVVRSSNQAIRRMQATIEQDRAAITAVVNQCEDRFKRQEGLYALMNAQLDMLNSKVMTMQDDEPESDDDSFEDDDTPASKRQKTTSEEVDQQLKDNLNHAITKDSNAMRPNMNNTDTVMSQSQDISKEVTGSTSTFSNIDTTVRNTERSATEKTETTKNNTEISGSEMMTGTQNTPNVDKQFSVTTNMSDHEDYDEDVGMADDANDDGGDDEVTKQGIRRSKRQKKARRRRSDSEEFPNPVFLHNVEIDLTPKQNKDITIPIHDDMLPGPLDWEKVENKRQRKYAENSRLKIDERPLKNIGTAREYWAAVLGLVGIQDWYDKRRVIKHIATSRAKAQQANTIPWRICRKWTLRALKSGSEQKWADDADINCGPIDDNVWEAVRIIGDTDEGFGTFPRTLLELLHQIGARFVLVKPEQRIIPQCWKKWADRTQYQYAGCQPNMFVARPVVNYKPPVNKSLRLKYHNADEDGAAPPDDDTDINLAVQGGARGPGGEVDKALVTTNDRAASALQRLNEAVFAKDENGDIDEDDVFMDALKNALTNGPIEGRIRELIHESFQSAGIKTTHKLYHTIQRIAQDVTRASNSAIRRLEAAIKEDRAAMTIVMTAYEERLQHQENMYTILKAQVENHNKRIGDLDQGESDSDDNASSDDEESTTPKKKQKVVDATTQEVGEEEVNTIDEKQGTQNESTAGQNNDTTIDGDNTMVDTLATRSQSNDTATATSSTIDAISTETPTANMAETSSAANADTMMDNNAEAGDFGTPSRTQGDSAAVTAETPPSRKKRRIQW
ncbi:hypothetical protein F4861DRAFT_540484 [Xylaria intraflava]|nr:hypothetical protein F4861DRAFT_540484 [Xylaria intraflava]